MRRLFPILLLTLTGLSLLPPFRPAHAAPGTPVPQGTPIPGMPTTPQATLPPPPGSWGKAGTPTPVLTPTPSATSSPGGSPSPNPIQQVVQQIFQVIVPVGAFMDVVNLLVDVMWHQFMGGVPANLIDLMGALSMGWDAVYAPGVWNERFARIHGATMPAAAVLAALLAALAVALHFTGRSVGVPSDPRLVLAEIAAGVLLAYLSLDIVRLSGMTTLHVLRIVAPQGPVGPLVEMAQKTVGQFAVAQLSNLGGPGLILVAPVIVTTFFTMLLSVSAYATLVAVWPLLLYAAAGVGPIVAAVWMARPTRFAWWLWLKFLLVVNLAVVAMVIVMSGMAEAIPVRAGLGSMVSMFQIILLVSIAAGIAGVITRSVTSTAQAGARMTLGAIRGVVSLASLAILPAAAPAALGAAAGAIGAVGAGAAGAAGAGGGGLAGTVGTAGAAGSAGAMAQQAASRIGHGLGLEAAGHALGLPSLSALGRGLVIAGQAEMAEARRIAWSQAMRARMAEQAAEIWAQQADLLRQSELRQAARGREQFYVEQIFRRARDTLSRIGTPGGPSLSRLQYVREGFVRELERAREGFTVPMEIPVEIVWQYGDLIAERVASGGPADPAVLDDDMRFGAALARRLTQQA